tara:strand:- start:864 stop:1157 length:294 start_codon:yes stop_codon:yes gene_type:complete
MYKIVDGKQIEMTAEEISAHNSWSETDAQKLQKIKDLRLDKLMETDWWVLRGNMTEAQTQYRQKLRDIPADYDSSKYDELLARDTDGNLTHSVWSKP